LMNNHDFYVYEHCWSRLGTNNSTRLLVRHLFTVLRHRSSYHKSHYHPLTEECSYQSSIGLLFPKNQKC
jgi:hypothetical protein